MLCQISIVRLGGEANYSRGPVGTGCTYPHPLHVRKNSVALTY